MRKCQSCLHSLSRTGRLLASGLHHERAADDGPLRRRARRRRRPVSDHRVAVVFRAATRPRRGPTNATTLPRHHPPRRRSVTWSSRASPTSSPVVAAPPGCADRPELAPLVRRREPPARPALPPPRYPRAAAGRRQRAPGARRGAGERQLQLLARCEVEGVAICLLNSYVNPVHEQRLRELTQEALGDVAVSISSETSPLAKEYARASTTVVDVFMRLIFTEYAARDRLGAARARLRRRAQLRRLRCNAPPVAGGAREAVPDRLRRPGGGHGLEHPLRRGDRRSQPDVLRRRRDVDGHLARRRRAAVCRKHVRARARPDHQRALDARSRASARAAAASSRSRRPATSRSGPGARARCLARPATAAVASSRRSPTPAC